MEKQWIWKRISFGVSEIKLIHYFNQKPVKFGAVHHTLDPGDFEDRPSAQTSQAPSKFNP